MSARITMPLADYLSHGRRDSYACVQCGHLGEPRPVGLNGVYGIERECSACLNFSAVPIEQAASENWLRVIDADGRVLNDRQAMVP